MCTKRQKLGLLNEFSFEGNLLILTYDESMRLRLHWACYPVYCVDLIYIYACIVATYAQLAPATLRCHSGCLGEDSWERVSQKWVMMPLPSFLKLWLYLPFTLWLIFWKVHRASRIRYLSGKIFLWESKTLSSNSRMTSTALHRKLTSAAPADP